MQAAPRPWLPPAPRQSPSSWSVANANGFSDGERIPLAVAINNLRRIVAATDLPVTVDLESGYGDSSEIVAVAISQAIEAGAVG